MNDFLHPQNQAFELLFQHSNKDQSDDSKFDITLVASTKPEYKVETVGSLLKNLRLNNKLSQPELAEIFKVNYRTISDLETNKIKKIDKYLIKYQEYFNIDIYEYIKGEQ